jgi:hypothetical protein
MNENNGFLYLLPSEMNWSRVRKYKFNVDDQFKIVDFAKRLILSRLNFAQMSVTLTEYLYVHCKGKTYGDEKVKQNIRPEKS